MRDLTLIWICLGLAGCVASQEVLRPNEVDVYTITCSENGWATCYQEAGNICQARGYEIANQHKDNQTSKLSAANRLSKIQPGQEMHFQCKEEPRPLM